MPASITEVSPAGQSEMPREGARVALVKAIRRTKYLERLREEEQQAQRAAAAIDARRKIIYNLLAHRYIEKRVRLPSSTDWLTRILRESPDHIFKHHVRMSREAFGKVLHILETKSTHIFTNNSFNKQYPVATQLMLAFYTLGFNGNGAAIEQARTKFGLSYGTIVNARRRVVEALFELSPSFIRWPNEYQRKLLCDEVRERYGYENAFFCVDGKTHNFAFKPGYETNSWYDRKSNHSMQALVTIEIHLLVINLVVGWPGCTHDARVLRSADYMNPELASRYFTGNQPGLGDAAFGIHRRAVSNYKAPHTNLAEKEAYNYYHSKMRIKSEHTIGHVKGRFQGLREMRLRLKKKESVPMIVKFITAGYVLHNILLEVADYWNPPYDPACIQQVNDSDSDSSDSEAIDEDDESAIAFRETVKWQVLNFRNYS